MPKTSLLGTDTVSFQELLANGRKYRVSPYQRDYSWDEDNWEDLWEDIRPGSDMTNPHYMGAIVLREIPDGDGEFEIIDGQQRIATLSLLVIAVLYWLKKLQDDGIFPEENDKRSSLLRNNYLGETEASSLHYSNKLQLNSNDDGFYREYLLQIKEPNTLRNSKNSNKLLNRAYRYFRERLGNETNLVSDGGKLASFLEDTLRKRLIFIRIVVEDESAAYTVFETLNARGIDLTATDLLKNYLFSFLRASMDKDMLRQKWDRIADLVGSNRMPEFLRHQLNSRRSLVRSERLFKTVREEVKERDDAFRLTDDLGRDAGIYAALKTPEDDRWRKNREIRGYIRALRLFNTKQNLPFLLAGYNSLGGERLTNDFRDILRISLVISFRYLVISRLGTNLLERVYNDAAIAITEEKVQTPSRIFEILREAYVDDERFKINFSSRSLSRPGYARYVLYELENDLRESSDVSGVLPANYETDEGTIEHVLPVNAPEEWKEVFGSRCEEYVHRLGNMTLLSDKDNRKASNLNFFEKRPILSGSEYLLSSGIDAGRWNPQAIDDRQEAMAKRAVHIWRLDFDS